MPCYIYALSCVLQAVTEEVGDRTNNMKQRQLVQLVTPENPQYMYNYAEGGGTEVDLEAPSVCGKQGSGGLLNGRDAAVMPQHAHCS
jgi:hypothetical protein